MKSPRVSLNNQNDDLVLESIAKMRSLHFSPITKERDQALELVKTLPPSHAIREYIWLYKECLWRETKLSIIKELGNFSDDRSIEFLMDLAKGTDDLPIAEASIASLGKSRSPLASRFLCQLYLTVKDSRKSVIIGAISRIPDRSLVEKFKSDFTALKAEENHSIAQSYVLALGELKVTECETNFLNIIKSTSSSSLRLAALISLGKVSRSEQTLLELEPIFISDPLDFQVYSNAKSQVRFRSQWTLEDYLEKIFKSEIVHRGLLLELNEFKPEDVLEGLKLYAAENAADSNFDRLCDALAQIQNENIGSWYDQVFNVGKLSDREWEKVLTSLSHHYHSSTESLLKQALQIFENHKNTKMLIQLSRALSFAHPKPSALFETLIATSTFQDCTPSEKTEVVNAITAALLPRGKVSSKDPEVKILMGLFNETKDSKLKSRIVRSLGQLKLDDDTIVQKLHLSQKDSAVQEALLYFAASVRSKLNLQILDKALESKNPANSIMLLRALSNNFALLKQSEILKAFLRTGLDSKNSDVVNESLRFLSLTRWPDFLKDVIEKLKSPESQLTALLAAKSYGHQDLADSVGPLLKSKNLSVVGRALDVLTSLPGIRAKRIVIDALKENLQNSDFCEKVIRSLEVPESGSDYFLQVLNSCISQSPNHPHMEGLVDLRDRIRLSNLETPPVENSGPLDDLIRKSLKNFDTLDPEVKTILRSAEMPILYPELFQKSVDKSASILSFCKALDLHIEKVMKSNKFFSSLESNIHQFQNIIHISTLSEDEPNANNVIAKLGLSSDFTPESFPLHKAKTMANEILSGRMVRNRFKSIDGLRAWAILILIYSRPLQSGQKAIFPAFKLSNSALVDVCKRLMALQELRNPAAHRQTFLDIKDVQSIQLEVFQLLALLT